MQLSSSIAEMPFSGNLEALKINILPFSANHVSRIHILRK